METDAYILTRQWLEEPAGTRLIYWCHTPGGAVEVVISGHPSVCFIACDDLTSTQPLLSSVHGWHHRSVNLRTFDQHPVTALYFESQRGLVQSRGLLEAGGINVFEADIRPTDRYLMERFITGPVRLAGTPLQRGNNRLFRNPRVRPSEFVPDLKVVSLDIETSYSEQILYSIAVLAARKERIFMVGSGASKCSALSYYPDEVTLIRAFLDWIEQEDPDFIIGWNIVNFDLDFLEMRCRALGLSFELGRNRQRISWRQTSVGGNRKYALVPGRVILDGIELLRTANYRFESFSLETVSRELLGRGKLVDDVEQRAEEIQTLYKTDPDGLARYNLEDCRLVWEIFELIDLKAFALERSKLTGLEIDRPGGSVAAFDYLYLPKLHREGYVAPTLAADMSGQPSPGGYVLNSKPGIYDDVIVLDFKSLYPSIIRTFRVDPLAMVEAQVVSEEQTVPGFRGARFSRSVGLLPVIIEDLWKARDAAKASDRRAMSHAIKIIMNSFYGVLGTTGCRFYDPRLVSSITLRGHEILQKTRDLIEQEGFSVIYGDTDSVFVWITDAREGMTVDETGLYLVDLLNKWWRDHVTETYGLESCLELEYETHYQRFFMPTVRGSEQGSKKRYAGMVSKDTDGLETEEQEQQIIFKGLESVRSDWSELAKNFQKELYRRIFLEQPYQKFVRDTVQSVLDGQRDAELTLKKRLRRKLGDYKKNIPPHVQAARKAELIRKQRTQKGPFDNGGWVHYIMTTSGPEPQQYRQSPIDYEFYIDKQLAPIADSILVFKSDSLAKLLDPQLGLF